MARKILAEMAECAELPFEPEKIDELILDEANLEPM
jgi:hypothetical protein